MFVNMAPTILKPGILAAVGLRPQDVFATTLYTGNDTARTITTGVDLTGGGTVWLKDRVQAVNHHLSSAARASGNFTRTNLTNAEAIGTATVSGFTTTGFTIGNGVGTTANISPDNFVAWSFKKAAKFYTEVVYTGDGTSGRQIAHDLGIAVGLCEIKRLDVASPWSVFHTSATGDLFLNTTAAQTASRSNITAVSALTFTVGSSADVNASGGTFFARLWAHDPDTTNGIVQCGSFTTDASGNGTITLGWQPQYLLYKASSTTGGWVIIDSNRGWAGGVGSVKFLSANTTGSETTNSGSVGGPTSTGVFLNANYSNTPNATYIYLAIRSPV